MTFAQMQSDLEAILATDLGYYKGDPTIDSATFTATTERKRLLNWAQRTVSKLCYIIEPSVPFEPIEDQDMYLLNEPQGVTQIIDLGSATIGQYTLSFTYGGGTSTTGVIDWDSSAAAVDTALEAIISADFNVTVTAIAQGFKVVFASTGSLSLPVPLLVMNSSLTATGNPAVRQAGLGNKCVRVKNFWINDQRCYDYYGVPGLYKKPAFERAFPGWRTADSGTPLHIIDRGHQIQVYPAADDTFILSASGNCFAEAQILYDDLINDNDVSLLPEELHEGLPMLAAFRATDPTIDEDGALRRMASLNSRWQAEVGEVRKRNMCADTDMGNTMFVRRQKFRS